MPSIGWESHETSIEMLTLTTNRAKKKMYVCYQSVNTKLVMRGDTGRGKPTLNTFTIMCGWNSLEGVHTHPSIRTTGGCSLHPSVFRECCKI